MQRMSILSDSDMSLFELKTRYVRNYLTFAGKNSKDYLLYLSAPGVYGSGAGNVYTGDQSVSILANNGYIDLNCETHNAYDASGFCNGYVKSEDFYWDAGSIVMVAPNDATKLIKIGQYRTGDYLIFTFKL